MTAAPARRRPDRHGRPDLPQVPFVEALIAAGADVNEKSSNGNSVIKNAISKGDAGVVRALLEAGADPEMMDNDRRPALHTAVKLGFMEIVKMLLDAPLLWPSKHEVGANINSKDWEDDTPLTLAAMWEQAEIAALLMARGVELHDKKKVGCSWRVCSSSISGTLRPSVSAIPGTCCHVQGPRWTEALNLHLPIAACACSLVLRPSTARLRRAHCARSGCCWSRGWTS
jgi:uncharacterized protein